MIADGVNFSEKVIKGMPLERFVAENIKVFWTDRDEDVRRKILEDVWNRINPKPKLKKAEQPVETE